MPLGAVHLYICPEVEDPSHVCMRTCGRFLTQLAGLSNFFLAVIFETSSSKLHVSSCIYEMLRKCRPGACCISYLLQEIGGAFSKEEQP